MTCSNDHPPIQYDEFHCPLCAEMADHADTIKGIEAAEETVQAYKTVAEDLAHADTLQLIAENELLRQRVERVEQRLRAVGLDMRTISEHKHTKAEIIARCRSVGLTIGRWLTEVQL